MMNVLIVAVGGTLGALARYKLGIWIGSRWNEDFLVATFVVNVIGCFLIGLLNVFVLERTLLSSEWRLGLGVGFLGAFTTFSTFTSETLVLLEKGYYILSLFYVTGSIIIGLLAAFLGTIIARAV